MRAIPPDPLPKFCSKNRTRSLETICSPTDSGEFIYEGVSFYEFPGLATVRLQWTHKLDPVFCCFDKVTLSWRIGESSSGWTRYSQANEYQKELMAHDALRRLVFGLLPPVSVEPKAGG